MVIQTYSFVPWLVAGTKEYVCTALYFFLEAKEEAEEEKIKRHDAYCSIEPVNLTSLADY